MSYVHSEVPKYVILAVWIAINVYVFITTYLTYADTKKYFYLKYIVGDGLPFSRGAAATLQFNCMIILLPVCRNLLSFIKNIPCLPRSFSRALDKNITFHKLIAYMICFCTVIHVGAHVFNFENLVSSWRRDDVISGYLNTFEDTGNLTQLNPVRKAGLDPIIELLKTIAGSSGIVITLSLIIMISSSRELIRRSYYEVFWFTHHLFVVFYIALLLHGFGRMLRYQDNTDIHDPVKCSNKTMWSEDICTIPPHFAKTESDTWKWVAAPLFIYFIERCIRFYRSFQPCTIKKIVKHPSRVIEIQMTKPGFYAKPGQYIFLHAPSISKLEWHPFTLTSSPEEDFISVHIRVDGDWTEALARCCSTNVQLCPLKLACDGPFGAPSSDVFRYKTIMCVGAGIGVTPFASILKSICYRQQRDGDLGKVTKLYFYWVCPESNAFEWFADLLLSLEQQMCDEGLANFFEYNIYLTRGTGTSDIWYVAYRDTEPEDAFTGLNLKVNCGRPGWDKHFSRVHDDHKGTNIGVCFCGPLSLSHALHKMANKYSYGDTKFIYNKENF